MGNDLKQLKLAYVEPCKHLPAIKHLEQLDIAALVTRSPTRQFKNASGFAVSCVGNSLCLSLAVCRSSLGMIPFPNTD